MVELLVQIADFIFKGLVTYARSEEGKQEFEDIFRAASVMQQVGKAETLTDLLNIGVVGESGNVGDDGKPLSQRELRAQRKGG